MHASAKVQMTSGTVLSNETFYLIKGLHSNRSVLTRLTLLNPPVTNVPSYRAKSISEHGKGRFHRRDITDLAG